MHCPNCGKKVVENQKFCSNCGTNLEDIINSKNENASESVENNDTKTEEQNFDNYYKNKSTPLNKTTKIISIIALCIIILALTTFGIKEYKQYQKDIEPLSVSKVRFDMGNISFDIKYDTNYRQAIICEIFEDIIAEDWLIGYFKDYYDNDFSVNIDKDEVISYPIDIKSNNINIVKGERPVVKYEITDVTAKDFAKIKETFKIGIDRRGSIRVSISNALDKNVKNRNRVKKEYFTWKKKVEAQKEAERKQKEWQEKVLSSCVYKTSNGVCFTTQLFEAEPIKVNVDGKERYDYWLGAKDACESRGYKLPNDDDLRALFQDILGIEIKSGIDIKSYKSKSFTDVPTNYDILKRIAPTGFNSYSQGSDKWKFVYLWEDREFDSKMAYYRYKDVDWGDEESSQKLGERLHDYSSDINVICVYNPNGKPHKSLVQIQKEKIEKEKKDLEAKKKQNERDIENALF